MRNLINDLKIYFIVQPTNDPLIRPWSILGFIVKFKLIFKSSFIKFSLKRALCKTVHYNL